MVPPVATPPADCDPDALRPPDPELDPLSDPDDGTSTNPAPASALVLPAIGNIVTWEFVGYNMLIFIAGLQSIPTELYEAAELDGATWWNRFRHVTLPNLAPTFLFVGIITMLGQFQLFAEPYVMTQGGPLKSTTSVVLLMYEEGFRWWRMGLAAALAFVLFVIMLIGTMLQVRLQKEREA